jgi:DNA-binding response OmpR family regulator
MSADRAIMSNAAAARKSATILVIDDDVSIQTLAAQALRGAGYRVLVAADMEEALQVSGDCPADLDLVVTDIMLPSGNGIALARALLAGRPNTPVLYMSGFGSEAIQAIQYEGGPNGGFLEKPFVPRVLVDRVRALLPPAGEERDRPSPEPSPAPPDAPSPSSNSEAVYRLETAVRCPQCCEMISTLRAVRLLRAQVNFTSTLPRRGRLLVCPSCLAIVPAELTNF